MFYVITIFLNLNDKYQIKAVAYAEEEGGECWKGIKKASNVSVMFYFYI